MYEKIVLIAPYAGLKTISDQVVEENNIDLTTRTGDMFLGVAEAQKAKAEGKKVIISRGGTAKVIRENVNIPVVEIKVTGYDLLRVLHKYKNVKKKIAVIGYDNVVSGAKVLSGILGIDIKYFPVLEEEEVEKKIELAYQSEIDIVIGDTIAVRMAERKGMEYELISSGKEAILNSIEEAIKLYEAIEIEREKNQRNRIVLDFINEGVVAVDKSGKIIIYNPMAEKIFGIPRENAMNKNVAEVIPNTRITNVLLSGKEKLGDIQNAGNAIIATNRVPIILEDEVKGVVVTFQDITKIQEVEKQIRQKLLKNGLTAKKTFNNIIGDSPIIQKAIKMAKEFAKSESTILISGESGTGKEVFAQSIHNESSRRNGPFVAINCAAIPGNLLESELFGYVEGAFTGARKEGKKGLFELADRGTIFLDEISEMDIQVQARILRVIQEMQVMRIGDDKIIPIDVRIIAATNKHLLKEVKNKTFRNDLYYRLNVLNIYIPPLRERTGDIEAIGNYLLRKLCKKYNKRMCRLSKRVVEILNNYEWPGNIREMENVMEKLVLIGEEEIFKEDSLHLVFNELQTMVSKETEEIDYLEGSLEEIEKKIIKKVLEEEGYNKTRAAERLAITRVTLNKKLKNV
ncbi:sigma 54-interacting transcriptional regulator [Alkaliphilus hydrothermalis]|uniref:PAS domain S-box-containing protein n=1 Tax=Alkaliphilus hydrothermalis TaxID=1482730 RepID=A0ABS2NRP8_9FIRM|nr:sigma 54-interacting transcriptional regulator [Alkaliphilus hydrothermalis]MBM7615622.1 PAS domain S-box-containing protein [Alkaliphilus hydrothermalis]